MVPTNTTGTSGTTGKTGSNQGYSEMKDDLQKSGEELSQNMKGKRDEVAGQASKEAKTKAEGAKSYAADEMEDLSHVAEAAADALSDENHEKLSSYVNDMASYVGNMADSLRNRSADDLVHDAKSMARKNPTLFIAGGIALGLGIARIAKSGAQGADANQANSSSLQSPTSGSTSGTGLSDSGASVTGSSLSSSGASASTTSPSTTTPGGTSTAKTGSLDSDFYKKSSQYDKV